jgi:hypothetical protein
MDDTFHVNKIILDGTHKTPPCAIARFYSCTTILCILRSKDIAPIHGIAHGRMDRDNVHAPEAVTLPMGVKATGQRRPRAGTSPGADHPAVLPRKRQHAHRYTKTEPRLPPSAPIRFAKQHLPPRHPPPPPSLYSFLPLPSSRLDASFSHRCRRGGGARRQI